jgi:RHS repeat-associated protein
VQELESPSALQTWHYSGDSDSPAWIAENASETAWTRNVLGPAGRLVTTTDELDDSILQLTNLHGDVIATADPDGAATSLLTAADASEFGVPRSATPPRYGWLGGYGRSADPATGSILMGARLYLPTAGRFLQVDPILGGSANAYDYANQDPQNQLDLAGLASCRYLSVEAPNFPFRPYWFTMRVKFCRSFGRVTSITFLSSAHGEPIPYTFFWNGFWRPRFKHIYNSANLSVGLAIQFPEWKSLFFHRSWCTYISFRGDGTWTSGANLNPNGICQYF